MSKPAVDGFERANAGRVSVVRLDVRSALGNALAYQFQVRAVPTFLLFSPDGELAAKHVGIATAGRLASLLSEGTEGR
ncbi:MAG: thioredoxin family protein [Anaerolineae bacterium]|jgi:thioredoxin-like negative regulator of GroEL|nr:thioredoxin family protein [Anaerolineae bacterium]